MMPSGRPNFDKRAGPSAEPWVKSLSSDYLFHNIKIIYLYIYIFVYFYFFTDSPGYWWIVIIHSLRFYEIEIWEWANKLFAFFEID